MCNKDKYEFPWDINDFKEDIQSKDGSYYKFISYDPEAQRVKYIHIDGDKEYEGTMYYGSWIKLSIRRI